MRRNESLEAPPGFHRYAFKNIVDLFSLTHCSFLIRFGQSTWSTFLQKITIKSQRYIHKINLKKSDRDDYIKMLEKK